MKIKKVDDKPMVIHTKEKAKIHSHEPKSASIKGSNSYTIDRTSKIKKASISEKPAKVRNTSDYIRGKNKQRYRKGTTHGTDSTRENGISRFRRTVRESGQSIKLKEMNLHAAGRIGAVGLKADTDQMEGGQEVQQEAYFSHEVTSAVTGAALKGEELFHKKSSQERKRKIKRVDAETNLAKRSVAVTGKRKYTVAKPEVGCVFGMGAGTGETRGNIRNRKITFFIQKMKTGKITPGIMGNRKKKQLSGRAMLMVKAATPVVGKVMLASTLMTVLAAVVVVAAILVLYYSPFALFLPPMEAGETVQSVASAYIAEFNQEIQTLAEEHIGYDTGKIVFVDYEGTDAEPDNSYDIMAVYMVKYGMGNTASVMNDTSKEWLKSVVEDMCSYSTSMGIVTDMVTNEDGAEAEVTTNCLYVNVTLKSYRDMISEYGFGLQEEELLGQIMSGDFMGQLGWSGNSVTGTDGGSGSGTMTETEISEILSAVSDSTQKAVCDYALHRVGYPYSQDYRDSGSYYDCSSLAYYSWQNAGKSIAYGGATTAAAEAEGLDNAGQTVSYDEMQPGDLIFYSFTNNGRYKNISHVAVYVGNGKAVEALNEKSGVVYREVSSVGKIVLIGRP